MTTSKPPTDPHPMPTQHYYCASPTCPGLPYRASDLAHPLSCRPTYPHGSRHCISHARFNCDLPGCEELDPRIHVEPTTTVRVAHAPWDTTAGTGWVPPNG